jgi:hypothetical protein
MMREVMTIGRDPAGRVQSLELSCGHVKDLESEAVDRLAESAARDRAVLSTDCKLCEATVASDDEAKRLILFVAAMCWNMGQGSAFNEQIEGHEDAVLVEFKKGVHPWEAVEVLPEDDG